MSRITAWVALLAASFGLAGVFLVSPTAARVACGVVSYAGFTLVLAACMDAGLNGSAGRAGDRGE